VRGVNTHTNVRAHRIDTVPAVLLCYWPN
jgi:hypothetical protein